MKCLIAIEENKESWLWDLRFGHFNFISLNQLRSKDMVIGLPRIVVPERVCESCMIGKQSRHNFNSYLPTRSIDLLHVIHFDVCGPMEVSSLGGNLYFLTFVDEFSRRMWLYLIKHKSEVFATLEKF